MTPSGIKDGNWMPGDAPTHALDWGIAALAKAGTLGVIGVYPPDDRFFPIGVAMNKNVTIKMGNCDHRAVTPPAHRTRAQRFVRSASRHDHTRAADNVIDA